MATGRLQAVRAYAAQAKCGTESAHPGRIKKEAELRMTMRHLRVIFRDDERDLDIATSISLHLPEHMGISEAADYIAWKISREVTSYAADECARHFFKS